MNSESQWDLYIFTIKFELLRAFCSELCYLFLLVFISYDHFKASVRLMLNAKFLYIVTKDSNTINKLTSVCFLKNFMAKFKMYVTRESYEQESNGVINSATEKFKQYLKLKLMNFLSEFTILN